MTATSRILCAAAALAIAGCATIPTSATYRGQKVGTINAVTMSCSSPFALTQNCSTSGPNLKVRAGKLIVRVAGSADGRIVVIMTEEPIPSQAHSEEAVDAVSPLVAPTGAHIIKMDALVLIGGTVAGYMIQFDRDVYSVLKGYAV
ncbi:MAG TPA: hypothetical protein VHA82_02735 [Ramlibacter sp.]|uniref:hypothetical protein n=1 Tax=Ramlibacter sp. TaxID=1917967 RepID=UPI002BABADAA|nr:hypothetical protein [Ramlibacter sp.]HVZ42700.1 hypothetical protein [Ramlibacter sp.]